ncbi:MAG: hypothetical protein ACKO9H_16375 [Planctomycetota bacterium]
MPDEKSSHQDRLLQAKQRSRKTRPDPETDALEASCAAFGYLRGLHERADALELRFREGHSTWFPYGWLGNWEFNPSAGLLLKFSGDLVYLVLIRGSNLDQPLTDSTINLTSAGLQRHRVVWIREMTSDEIRQVGESGPTIDRIEVVEFQTHEALKSWLQATAPAFLINP